MNSVIEAHLDFVNQDRPREFVSNRLRDPRLHMRCKLIVLANKCKGENDLYNRTVKLSIMTATTDLMDCKLENEQDEITKTQAKPKSR